MNTILVTTSWDDGHRLDLRLADLLRTWGMKGTFYVSPHNRELVSTDRLHPEDLRTLVHEYGFEVGAHTMTHPRLTTLSREEAEREIAESKAFLEAVVQTPVTSFCYPGGAYTDTHVALVRALGFTVGRTVERFSLTTSHTNLHTLPTTVHAYNHWSDLVPIMRLPCGNVRTLLRYYRHWDELAIALFEEVAHTGGTFHLWGHSWEIDAHQDWDALERVFRHIKRAPYPVIHLTNGELPAYAT